MKLSDFGLCKPLDSSSFPNLTEPDHGASVKAPLDGHKHLSTSAAPKRTQQEQLLHWQKNRRTLVICPLHHANHDLKIYFSCH